MKIYLNYKLTKLNKNNILRNASETEIKIWMLHMISILFN